MSALLERLKQGLRWVARALGSVSRIIYIILITLAVILFWLTMTTGGAQWLADRAMAEEERLELEITGGNLWNGLDVRSLRWQEEGLEVAISEVELRWDHLCLLQARVCLDLALARGVDVTVDTDALGAATDDADPAPDADDPDDGPFSLPVAVAFPDVRVQRVDARVDGHRVRWSDLRLGGELSGSTFHLKRFNWETILAELEEGDEEPVAALEDDNDTGNFLETGWQALELPDVRLPLDVVVDDFRVHELRVVQGSETFLLDRLSVAGGLRGPDLVLTHLDARHEQGRIAVNGSLSFMDDWPVDLDIRVDAEGLPEIGDLELRAQLWNSVGDLDFSLDTRGPAAIHLEGTVAAGQDNLPFRIEGSWDQLQWPLDTGELIAARDGRLRATGDLTDYRIELGSAIDGADIPEGEWQLAGQGDLQHLELEQLQGDLLGGSLDVAGRVSWHPEIVWDVTAHLDGIDADALVAQAPAGITGRLSTHGRFVDDDIELDATVDGLHGRVEGYDVRLDGRVHRPLAGDWTLDDVLLRSGESRLALAGTVGDDALDLEGQVDVGELGAFMPELAGALHGDFAIRGPFDAPDIRADLDGTGLAYGDLGRIGELALRARVDALGEQDSEVSLVAADITSEYETVHRLALDLAGDRGDHVLELDLDAERIDTALRVEGGLNDALHWDGLLASGDVQLAGQGWRLDRATPLEIDPMAAHAAIGAHCWRHEEASLCAPETIEAGATGNAELALSGFQLNWLQPWLPPQVELAGALSADVEASWGDGPLPQVRLVSGVDGGAVRLTDEDADDDEVELTLEYERLALNVDLDRDALGVELELLSEALGSMRVDARTTVENGDTPFGPLEGNVEVASVRLDVLEPFFPEMRTLRGTLSASGELAGEVTDPSYHGTVELEDGRLEPLAVGVSLTDIGLRLDVDGHSATLEGGFRSGDGSATLAGEADWSGEPVATINLEGAGLQVVYEPVADLRVDPDLQVQFGEGVLSLSGSLDVPRGDITLAELPESAVRLSGDVVMIDDMPEDGALPDDDEGELEAPGGLDLQTDIQLTLGNRVELSGYGITGRLVGDLRLQQSGGSVPQGNGEIRIVDGRYRAYGQRLQIREGQLLFAGPLDRPQIYVEAVRRIERDDVTAGLRLEGNPEEPRVSLFSEPAMAEEDVLSYIILGRPAGESGPGGENMMARAAIALGVAGGGGYATAVAEGLGIEDFAIDTEGEGDETQVVMGGYINPNLYLGYGVGVFTPVNTLTLRYQLATNLFLEAVSSLENAIDLIYRFEFGSRE
ncbi:autotransporter assembly complex protein TamB [Aquisalimonas asiatica]|uniref:Translocation and assembly module TamB n=1 Tax=Aquisalimonas asiatica TaxID=406100 RepID=A0A1H8QAU7_9GAMM|nr:translocation/assembly module TamB domain-containing protein [Aquisalimonas asiatica]SEO50883.1 translocation and assembly module TamB [Aquisalimonas asiatica]